MELRFKGLSYRQTLKAYDFIRPCFKEELASRAVDYNRLEVYFSKYRIVLWLRLGCRPDPGDWSAEKAILTRTVFSLCQRLSLAQPPTWALCTGLLALLNGQILPVAVGGVAANRLTAVGDRSIDIQDTQHYWREMGKNQVYVDNRQREKQIRQLLGEAAAKAGGNIVTSMIINAAVINCERPYVQLVPISANTFQLSEILALIVLERMGFFALQSKTGALLALGAFVGNVGDNPPDLNKELADASGAYQRDLAVPFQHRLLGLQSLPYLSKLGSLADKQQRLKKIVLTLASQTDAGQEISELAKQGAAMAKLDLATETCSKYPEFLGHMGAKIAQKAGVSAMVATAIIEHWHPSKYSQKLPHTLVGAVLGVADRLDSICGQFYQSEFKLSQYRRVKDWFDQVIAIIASVPLDISLANLLKFSLSLYESQGLAPWRTGDLDLLKKLCKERVQVFLEAEGFSAGIAAALTAHWPDNVYLTIEKAKTLAAESGAVEECSETCKLLDRVCARDYNYEEATREYLEQQEEVDLFEVYLSVREEVNAHLQKRVPHAALARLARLRIPLQRYVNAVDLDTHDQPLRANRLSLLGEIRGLYHVFGDFSLL